MESEKCKDKLHHSENISIHLPHKFTSNYAGDYERAFSIDSALFANVHNDSDPCKSLLMNFSGNLLRINTIFDKKNKANYWLNLMKFR